jgi:DNA polymerase
MLAAIGLRLEDVALMNMVPWRPPGNASLKEQDVTPLLGYVKRAIQLLAPRFVLGFTATPGFYLANGDASFPRQRGKWLTLGGAHFLSTFHPEEMLKTPAQKRLAWRDLLAFKERLND